MPSSQQEPEKVLLLYSTLGCHLCEDAKKLAWPVLEQFGYRLIEVDIADDPMLMETYALKIPVLFRKDTRAELSWPFDEDMLTQLLTSS